MKPKPRCCFFGFFLLLVVLIRIGGPPVALGATPEPQGWYAGDAHVHLDCGVGSGHDPVTPEQILSDMKIHNLAVVSLLADMGNGEVREATRDLPRINGQDFAGVHPGRLLHWDAEWHFDPKGVTFEQKMIGGHLILLGLSHAKTMFAEYNYPVISWAKSQKAIVGFAHMQYLSEGIPEELSCCLPLEYPVETALGTSDFLMEDVWRNEAALLAYYRLLNCGFRPGLAAGTDFPCNSREPIGSLLTYVHVKGGELTYKKWIEGIAQGRTVISTSGHEEFLDMKVNESSGPGDEIFLKERGAVRVAIRWTSAKDLHGRVEIVRNGTIVASEEASTSPEVPFTLHSSQEFSRSGWLCARRMNAQGHQTHTAAVFITVNQAPVRVSATDAEYFVRFIENLLQKTSPGGPWNPYFSRELEAAQSRYRKAKAIFEKIASEARAK